MTTAAPERSLDQRMDALQRANEIRTRRAQLKRDIASDRADVLAVIATPPDYVETMKLFDLILAAPKYGRVKVNKVLTTCRISPSKTIGGLSPRQRSEVVALLYQSHPFRSRGQIAPSVGDYLTEPLETGVR